jgi:hypothetical protein
MGPDFSDISISDGKLSYDVTPAHSTAGCLTTSPDFLPLI